jgi:hypothetical protein
MKTAGGRRIGGSKGGILSNQITAALGRVNTVTGAGGEDN